MSVHHAKQGTGKKDCVNTGWHVWSEAQEKAQLLATATITDYNYLYASINCLTISADNSRHRTFDISQ